MLRIKIFSLLIVLISIVNLHAEQPRESDLPGSKDHPKLSRYHSAVLNCYDVVDYGQYVLGVGKEEEKNFRGHGRYFTEYIDLEGRITRIQYLIPQGEGIYKVYKNYEDALRTAGFKLLYQTSDKQSSWPFWTEVVYWSDGGNGINQLPGNFFKPFARDGFHYLAAAASSAAKKYYIALFVNKINEAGKEYIMVTQDVIETKAMESGLVTAEKMSRKIEDKGRVVLEGVYFDTGKSTIKPESGLALTNIATYLKNNRDKNFYIVGHTDNRGDFTSNMALSENRAKAVRQELISSYGINPGQLRAYGVSSLCPVFSNSTDAGRAKNRRVEIVER